MPKTHYWLVSGGVLLELDEGSYVVPVDEFNEAPSMEILRNAADNPGLAVIPVIEQLEHEPDFANMPDFDLLEQLGFDGTGRTEPTGMVTWEQVARRLLELRAVWLKPTRVKLTDEIVERLAELQTEIESPDSSLSGASIVVSGVELQVGESLEDQQAARR
jgi:hypothetical protein